MDGQVMNEEKKQYILTTLPHFTGSENWYQHSINRALTYTDGAKFVAEECGAYWLLDEIAIRNKHIKTVAREPFQVWKLTVNREKQVKGVPLNGAVLTCDDGNGNVVHTYRVPFTDFPLDEITFYVADNVILLPSEY
jgi:hypothetical protein